MGDPMAPKRTAQVSPDRFSVGIAAIILVMIIMLASMVFSYVAIAEAGEWTHVPYGMHWLAPVFIDGAILTYTVSLAVFQARGADRKTIRRTRVILWGFTLLSVAVNFAHAGSGWGWDFGSFEAWFGCAIAVSAPLAALTSAEEVVRLAFKKNTTTPTTAPVETETAAETVEAATEPVEAPAAVTGQPEPVPAAPPAADPADDPLAALEAAVAAASPLEVAAQPVIPVGEPLPPVQPLVPQPQATTGPHTEDVEAGPVSAELLTLDTPEAPELLYHHGHGTHDDETF